MYEASKALLKEKTIKRGRVKESDLRSEIESETTLHVIPPGSETLPIASIPHIVALEVELPHGW